MKQKNFNLNISTLDDKVLYQEICRKIRQIESISFKLLIIVPVISGTGMILLWLKAENLSHRMMFFIAIFSALITFFIFLWEKRNRQTGITFRQYACIIEARKNEIENTDPGTNIPDGPYLLFKKRGKPHLFSNDSSKKGWGKGEAETGIYLGIVIFWLLLPLIALL